MKDFSIVIAHRGDPLGLWATIHSCEIELKDSGYDYEYCICANGEAELKSKRKNSWLIGEDLFRVLHFLEKSGRGGKQSVLQRSISPPSARERAAQNAKGKYLFFLDNHCLVSKGYFKEALRSFKRHEDLALVHSATHFFSGEDSAYEYKLSLDTNFWATSVAQPKHTALAYSVAAAGHGGFAVDADIWRSIGGYWDGFVGYGGEELTIDLQLWMRGYKVVLAPQMQHFHWAGKRPYSRHFTPDYYRNMMMSANIIGGEKWMYKVFDSFNAKYPAPLHKPFFTLMTEAYYKSAEYAAHVRQNSNCSLDELLAFFKVNDIPH